MFDYTDASKLANVVSHLTPDRLTRYLAASLGDTKRAIELYVWNTAISSAFYFPLQTLEVGLRNGLHAALGNTFGAAWHDTPEFLATDSTGGLATDIQRAKDELIERNKPPDTPHLVASLTFGFWAQLTSSRFETDLWLPCLHRAFPNYIKVEQKPLRRGQVSKKIKKLNEFRNRIAHHEPIFHYTLAARYDLILSLCSWMYTDLRDWVECNSTVSQILSQQP